MHLGLKKKKKKKRRKLDYRELCDFVDSALKNIQKYEQNIQKKKDSLHFFFFFPKKIIDVFIKIKKFRSDVLPA